MPPRVVTSQAGVRSRVLQNKPPSSSIPSTSSGARGGARPKELQAAQLRRPRQRSNSRSTPKPSRKETMPLPQEPGMTQMTLGRNGGLQSPRTSATNVSTLVSTDNLQKHSTAGKPTQNMNTPTLSPVLRQIEQNTLDEVPVLNPRVLMSSSKMPEKEGEVIENDIEVSRTETEAASWYERAENVENEAKDLQNQLNNEPQPFKRLSLTTKELMPPPPPPETTPKNPNKRNVQDKSPEAEEDGGGSFTEHLSKSQKEKLKRKEAERKRNSPNSSNSPK